MALIWVMQLARWPSSRVRTSVLTPSHVDRKRVTSFMHSLKPARYFPSTLGSVLSAAVICARCRFRRCFTVISRMSAFSSLECLELSFLRASKISVFSWLRLSFILALRLFSMMGFDDFLCSDAVFGLSGVVLTLAGVAATGDEEFFSIISAGIFCFVFFFFFLNP